MARLPVAAVMSCAVALCAPAAASETMTDSQGRTFRVRFDPGSELRLGLMGGPQAAGGEARADGVVSFGLAYRSLAEGGMKHQEARWQLDHRALFARIEPWRTTVKDVPALDATLYSGTYLRHTDDPFLMLPTSPPKRMYFPFDIGVEAEAGRVRLTPSQAGEGERLRIGAARAAVLLDPIRSGKPGRALPLGFGLRYDVDIPGDPELDEQLTVHRLAPFTEVSLGWRYQDDPGLTTMEARAAWFPHWASKGGWQIDAFESSAALDRVLIAVNDTPVSVGVDLGYTRYPGAGGAGTWVEMRALAGARVGWQLR